MSEKLLNGFTREFLSGLFSYNPRTGEILRRMDRSPNAKAGQKVGTVDGKGYLHVSVLKKFVRLHRLAFFLQTGETPLEIDHIDRDRTNNTWQNLRPALRKDNVGNSAPGVANTSGFKGVSYNKRGRVWHAQIKINGKQTYLGRSRDPLIAARLYDKAAVEHFGEFAYVNGV